jgi:hypothetical protein
MKHQLQEQQQQPLVPHPWQWGVHSVPHRLSHQWEPQAWRHQPCLEWLQGA